MGISSEMRAIESKTTASRGDTTMRINQPSATRVGGLRNTNTGQFIPLPARSRMVVGSQPSCDITLADPYISKLHAVIERLGDRLFVRDRNSANGTFVNGYRVEGAELRVGTAITLGKTRLVALADEHAPPPALAGLIGQSEAFRRCIATAIKIAPSSCNVLIAGETGTGKELFARLLHDASPRATAPYVAVNCGAIPGELIASELFGHTKGSFTGAHADRTGYFELAHQGTLFLDELGEMPHSQQPALLRALESGVIRKVGGAHDMAVNVRVVAATNRVALAGGEAASRVRLDLFHRLATVTIALPPLRQRRDDILILTAYFLAQLSGEFGERALSERARDALLAHPWPGNIRELRHAVTRAVNLGGEVLEPGDFFANAEVSSTLPLPSPARPAKGHPWPVVPQRPGGMGELRPYYPPLRRRPPVSNNALFDTSDAPSEPAATGLDPGFEELDSADVIYDGETPANANARADVASYEDALRAQMIAALETNTSLRGAARLMGMPKSTFISRARQLGLLSKHTRRE